MSGLSGPRMAQRCQAKTGRGYVLGWWDEISECGPNPGRVEEGSRGAGGGCGGGGTWAGQVEVGYRKIVKMESGL